MRLPVASASLRLGRRFEAELNHQLVVRQRLGPFQDRLHHAALKNLPDMRVFGHGATPLHLLQRSR